MATRAVVCRLWLAALPWISVDSGASASELTVRVTRHAEGSSIAVGPGVEVVATRVEVAAEPTSMLARTDASGTATLQLHEGSWSLTLGSSAYWAAPQLVELKGARGEAALRLWPAAGIVGAVGVPQGAESPGRLALRFQRAAGATADAVLPLPPGHELDCPVDARRKLSCVVPAGVWNLRLKAPGFAATYRWGLDLAAARERSLGTLELRRGTSLTGQVVTEDGSADLRAVRVEVRPLATCRPATERQNHEAQQLVADSAVDEQGYFTLYDLPAGDYDVTARSSGYAPASRSGVLLKDGRDTLIQSPLQLRRPLLLELSIRPAEELYGRQWAVRLIRLLPRSRPEIAATGLARGGVFKTAPLPPGGYRVEVSDSRGNRLAQSELRLDAGAQQHSIDLDLIPVDGKVSLGGAPLAASIWFGGETGGGLKIEARSNGEGDFHVVLPGAGKWSADVQSDEPSVRSRKVAVEIDRPQAGSTAQTRIELPDTVLRGEVVDGTGKGLGSVPVRLLALEPQPRSASVSSDSQGRFELRGQDPGSYQLQAVTKGVSSPVVQAVLQEGVVAGPVRLVLRPTLQVKGRVRSPGGPVPLAWILGYPLGSNDAMAAVHLPQITSGVDGSFTLEVPPETSAVRLVVLAGGFDFHVETLPAEVWQGGLLTVSVERSGGTVRLVGLGDDRSSQAVMIDGVPVERPLLEQWAGINGATRAADVLELPAMPSANYTVCRTTPRELMRLMTGAPVVPGPACKEGYLTPGGELSLSVAPRS